MQQAGIVLDEISKTTELSPVSFLKATYNFVKIKERQYQPNFNQLVGVMITKIAVLAGIKNEIDYANKSDLLRFVKTRCNSITLEEFYKAFEMERFGMYDTKTDHFQLFNAEYCASIINKYLKWKRTSQIEHNLSNTDVKSLPDVTDSQKKGIMNNALIRVFNEFKQSKTLPQPCNYIFDELVERGMIKLGVTDKLVAYYEKTTRIARSQLLRELEAQKRVSRDKAESNSLKEQIEKITKGSTESVYGRVKKIVLTQYFTKLVLQEVDIKTLIDEKT